MATSRICSVDGCDKPVFRRTFCAAHYSRLIRHGHPLASAPERQKEICQVADCDREIIANGFCTFHYQRWKRHGDPLFTKFHVGELCCVDGCTFAQSKRGLCSKHYHRWKRHGDPLGGDAFRASKGEPAAWVKAHVSYNEDDCLYWPFSRYPDGAAGLVWKGRRVRGPRLMCELAHGPAPAPDLHAAHSCGHGHLACMNQKHLRWATPVENAADMVIHGTLLKGEASPVSKLLEDEVRSIKAMIGHVPMKEIAAQFRVTTETIRAIKAKRVWAWLT